MKPVNSFFLKVTMMMTIIFAICQLVSPWCSQTSYFFYLFDAVAKGCSKEAVTETEFHIFTDPIFC